MKWFVILVVTVASVAAAAYIPETLDFLEDVAAKRKVSGRIINGTTAAVGQFPYQVGLSIKKSTKRVPREKEDWCGGSLIGRNWVLTAAHCTEGADTITVYLGSTKRAVAEITHTVGSDSIYPHSGFNKKTLANDISLIKIPPVTYSSKIRPIKLPPISSSYSSYEGSYAITSGWGLTSETSAYTSPLYYARMQVIANSLCSASYGSTYVTAKTLCVSTENGSSTCTGDSGGPLVWGYCELIGVTSFVGASGCESKKPAGFVRVTAYLDWIKSHTGISY